MRDADQRARGRAVKAPQVGIAEPERDRDAGAEGFREARVVGGRERPAKRFEHFDEVTGPLHQGRGDGQGAYHAVGLRWRGIRAWARAKG